MRTYFEWILLIVASLLTIGDVILIVLSRKEEVEPTGTKQFFLEELFSVGFFLRRVCKREDTRFGERTRRLQELYSPTQAEQMSRNAGVASITYAVLCLPILILVLALTKDAVVFLLEVLLVAFLCSYFELWLRKRLEKRHEKMEADYATMLTKMSLMVQVGITATEAFERVAYSAEGVLYEEMQRAASNMANGMSVEEALTRFTLHCPLRGIKKFVSLFKQNLVKGGADFPIALNEMAENAWEDRKNRAKGKGEVADQKLLGPTLVMFVGILLMIMIPAFKNLF